MPARPFTYLFVTVAVWFLLWACTWGREHCPNTPVPGDELTVTAAQVAVAAIPIPIPTKMMNAIPSLIIMIAERI